MEPRVVFLFWERLVMGDVRSEPLGWWEWLKGIVEVCVNRFRHLDISKEKKSEPWGCVIFKWKVFLQSNTSNYSRKNSSSPPPHRLTRSNEFMITINCSKRSDLVTAWHNFQFYSSSNTLKTPRLLLAGMRMKQQWKGLLPRGCKAESRKSQILQTLKLLDVYLASGL